MMYQEIKDIQKKNLKSQLNANYILKASSASISLLNVLKICVTTVNNHPN